MTYTYEVLFCVILGLAVGNGLFNRTAMVAGICCVSRVNEAPLASPGGTRAAPLLSATRGVSLSVGGMSCGACVNTVTNGLLAQPGVYSAEVSLAARRADLRVDDDCD